jgi:UDP-glucuronate decarboxylase
VTIAEIAQRIVALTGSRSEIVYRPLPQDDPRQRCPDIARAKAMLHWSPKVGLDEGLMKTIAYFDALLSASASSVTPFEPASTDLARTGS